MIVLLIVLGLFNLVMGGFIGSMIERSRWNTLISQGTLPRPGQRWKAD